MKVCIKCKLEKDFGCFHNDRRLFGGVVSTCKECRKLEYTKTPEEIEEKRQKKYERWKKFGHPSKDRKHKPESLLKLSESQKKRLALKYDGNETQFRRVFDRYKARGLDWSHQEFKVFTQQECNYCGSLPKTVQKTKGRPGEYVYNGIDRMNNDIGYLKENCVPCCLMCNQSKLHHSKENFLDWVKKVYEHSYQKVLVNT